MQYLLTEEEKEKLTQSRESRLSISVMRNTILDAESTACKNWDHKSIEFLRTHHFLTSSPLLELKMIKHLSDCKGCPMVRIYLYIRGKFPNNYIQQAELQKTICPEMEYKDVRS